MTRAAAGVAAQLLTITVTFADRMLLAALLVRAWGPELYADWMVALSMAGMLSLGELGLNIYWGNRFQALTASGAGAAFQRTLAIALGTGFALSALLAAIAVAVAAHLAISQPLSFHALPAHEAALLFVLLAAAAVLRIARGSISQLYRGRRQFPQGVLVDLCAPAAVAGAICVIALSGGGVMAAANALILCDFVFGWGVMLTDLRRRWPDLRFRPAFPARNEAEQAARQLPWLAIQQGAPAVWNNAPIFIFAAAGAAAQPLVGFALLRTLANLSRTAGNLVAIPLGVEASYERQDGNSTASAVRIAFAGRLLTVVSAFLAIAILMFGDAFLRFWTGHESMYDPVTAFALCTAAILSAPFAAVGHLLTFSGSPRSASLALIAQLCIGIPLCTALSFAYGIGWGAAGLAAGEIAGQAIVMALAAQGQAGFALGWHYAACLAWAAPALAWGWFLAVAILENLAPATLSSLVSAGLLWGALSIAPFVALVLIRRPAAVAGAA